MQTVYAKNPTEWRTWLEKNHATETKIGLIYFKKSTGQPTLTWQESVEEALCFGWIDGIKHSVDEKSYSIRFTPRKPKSNWSLVNKNLCERLIAEGKMTEAGLKTIEIAKENGQWDKAYSLKGEQEIPEDFKKALLKNKKAWENFGALSNSNKFTYIRQIDVKTPELRATRIAKVVELLEQNIKPYVKGVKSLKL
ncbi:MAG: YdeI/OmpD-associated family protein [Bacteroidota bacterium]